MHGDPNFLSDAAQAERIAMSSQRRVNKARLALMQETDIMSNAIRRKKVDRTPEQITVSEYEAPLGKSTLKDCIRDYAQISTYLPMICAKRLSTTFQFKKKRGVVIKTKNGRKLVLLSTGILAEIYPLDKRDRMYNDSNILPIEIDDAIKDYGKDEELAQLLDQSIGVVNDDIQLRHKQKFPKHYFGDWYGVSDDDLLKTIQDMEEKLKHQKEELQKREILAAKVSTSTAH